MRCFIEMLSINRNCPCDYFLFQASLVFLLAKISSLFRRCLCCIAVDVLSLSSLSSRVSHCRRFSGSRTPCAKISAHFYGYCNLSDAVFHISLFYTEIFFDMFFFRPFINKKVFFVVDAVVVLSRLLLLLLLLLFSSLFLFLLPLFLVGPAFIELCVELARALRTP